MEKLIKISIVAVVAFLQFNHAIAGGPWTQQKGNGYYKLSEFWIVFDKHFTENGETDPNVKTGIFNTNLYAEYGVTDRVTTILNATLFSRNLMNTQTFNGTVNTQGEAINGLGDIDLGIKYGLTKPGSKVPIAVSLYLGLPTGRTDQGTLKNLQTGDGEFNQLIQIDAGKGFKLFNKINSYVSGYTGFNHRTNGFSEELKYGIEYGAGLLNQSLWIIVRINGVESFKNGITAQDVSNASIFANNTEYTSYALEANYYVTKKMGLSAAYASAFRGEIIAAAPSYSVGVFLDLSK
ncbi:MAG: hypothetical protein AB8B61_00775 [Cyclobacteriaceae bacterium]